MTRDDAKKLIMIITYSYPNFKPQDLSLTVDVWASMLKDYEYKECELALKNFIMTDTKGFAPGIGQLVNAVDKLKHISSDLNEMEVWDMVSKAIGDSLYHAEERFNELPEVVQRVVGTPSQLHQWAMVDSNSVQTVIQSNVIKTYRAELNKQVELRRMPSDVKMFIEQTQQKMIGVNDE